MFNDYPKCRSWTVVRMVMPAALAKLSLLDDYPKCRSWTVVRMVMPAAWAKLSLLDDYPKCRSWTVVQNGVGVTDGDVAAPSVSDGWLRKLSQSESTTPESYLKTIYAQCPK